MIKIDSKYLSPPIIKFKSLYDQALGLNQNQIEAASICTINKQDGFPESRYVNIKYIKNNNFIFFTNYLSNKGRDIKSNNKCSCLFFWDSINVQIRIKGIINKTDKAFSDNHFKNRSYEKNILSISSSQSQLIHSYDAVKSKYKKIFNENFGKNLKRPNFWGGYQLIPNYFEFWLGDENRINKREVFKLNKGKWEKHFLEP